MAAILSASFTAAQSTHLAIDASKAGAKIDRNIFGQFAENLGHGLYEARILRFPTRAESAMTL
jgi:alpha-N-arabinofuranosidase